MFCSVPNWRELEAIKQKEDDLLGQTKWNITLKKEKKKKEIDQPKGTYTLQ